VEGRWDLWARRWIHKGERGVGCCRNGSVSVCPQPHCRLPVFPSSSRPPTLCIRSRPPLHRSAAVAPCLRYKAKGCPFQNRRRHSSQQSPCCWQAYPSQAPLSRSTQTLRPQWTLHLYCLRRLITTNKLFYSIPSSISSPCTQISSLQLSSNAAIVKHEQHATVNLSTAHFLLHDIQIPSRQRSLPDMYRSQN